ncbi:MAG: thiolase family protein [Chloroflexota bacterium]
MRDVVIIGVNMTKFGKFPDRSMKSLAREAVEGALKDAGVSKEAIQIASVGNCVWGLIGGQEGIRGQVVLRDMGIGGMPVINVENACASASTALHVVWSMIAGGMYDVGLAVGMEKLITDDPEVGIRSYLAQTDVEETTKILDRYVDKSGTRRSIFMDIYAKAAVKHMKKFGTTQRQLAAVSSKNHFHSTLNPYAMYQKPFSVEEILQAREVVYPLTQPMCSPMSDGAAAAIICSANYAKKIGASKPIKILASMISSGKDRLEEEEDIDRREARKMYATAGVGPEDIDVAEVHDATAFAEIHIIESMGLCPEGEGGPFSEAGNTRLGGKIPVNVSGGLESKGHPIGATGLGQTAEIVWQLRGEAGARQVKGAKTGLVHNGGGRIIREDAPTERAALSLHILQR